MRPLNENVRRLASQKGGIVLSGELTPVGLNRNHLRDDVLARRAVRLHPGVFVVTDGEGVSNRQRMEAAQEYLGPESTLVLGSAARIHGIQGVASERAPEVALPPGLEKRQRAGVEIRFWSLPEDHTTVVDGLRVTTVARTLADLARELPRVAAVACLDSALLQGQISLDELPSVAAMMQRKRGCVSGRRRLTECRVGAQSPLETGVRLACADGGMPPDALQVPIYDSDGRLLGYGDLGWRLPDGTWLIAEADGLSVHEAPKALLHDRRRQNAFLSAANAQIVRFTSADLRVHGYIASVIRPILARAGWPGFRPVRPSPR